MPSPLHAGTYSTPVGDLSVLVDPASGSVVCSHFGTVADAAREVGASWVDMPDARVAAALASWASGDGSALAEIPVYQAGSELQQEIWAAVRAIPSGETATYGEIALEVGRPRAARAVGTACARNLTTPFTPCHRVVSASGIGGFGGATSLKRRMLELEMR
ncbi:methylated-DNA--[protein]-cysteine S-methyltransferase [Demequina sp.]|uniref:methylated-DNA--[protein]-cysteine S-methyltransferase n=1 Tax=Demequina sp. TaxID=2050685 RepID=UPI003D0CC580